MSNDLSQSVIIPRDDFLELQASAFNPNDTTAKTRVASTVQTTLVFTAMAAAMTAGTYGWAKGMDWLEERRFQREMRRNERLNLVK